jgi:hypothetical protein
MLNLKVDEAYAFDYLSILEIKKNKIKDNFNNWINCFDNLKNQLDHQLFDEIIKSEEYKLMIIANSNTFDAVEKARYGQISAKEVDELNMERYNAKIKFQNKFFATKKITETKS